MTTRLYGWTCDQWAWAAEAHIRAEHVLPPGPTGMEGLIALQHWFEDRHTDDPGPLLVLVGGGPQKPLSAAREWAVRNFYLGLADPSVFRALRHSKEHA